MELLSVEYGDFQDLFDSDQPYASTNACLKIKIAVDLRLLEGGCDPDQLASDLGQVFPTVRSPIPPECSLENRLDTVARLVSSITLDLQRDLCEWPTGYGSSWTRLLPGNEYELCVESIDERVGRFAAQLAVQVVRMMLLQENFDPRLIWLIDLVRRLRRQPRLRLSPKRVAGLLSCSEASAEWAIQALERYGYLTAEQMHHPRHIKRGRILVIDDSAQIRDLLSRILEWLGFDVVTAVDGEEGLILLGWATYKAIFVDLIMPSLDGKTFIQRARASGVTSPIFVVSAYDYRWSPNEVKAFGATSYISKPFSFAEIEAAVKTLIK